MENKPDVKNDIVFWELGVLLKEFVESKSIPTDNITDELEKNFRKIEKQIRTEGLRKDKIPLPTWRYKDQNKKKMKECSHCKIIRFTSNSKCSVCQNELTLSTVKLHTTDF